MNATISQQNREQFLRRRISESFAASSERIDREVAEAFLAANRYESHFTSEDLTVVFANIFYTLVELQRFAGLSVPVTHNVAQMQVTIRHPHLSARSILHIHHPIQAFIELSYKLTNVPDRPGALALVRDSVRVKQTTRRFDLVAKAMLSAMDVAGLIESELNDPAQVIRKTLAHRLKTYGFAGEIRQVELEITPEHRLRALLKCRRSEPARS